MRHNPIIKIVNPLCVAEVAHIFIAAIRVVYNLISDPAVMLKALEILSLIHSSPRTAVSSLIALLLIPLTLVFGPKLLGDRSYYCLLYTSP